MPRRKRRYSQMKKILALALAAVVLALCCTGALAESELVKLLMCTDGTEVTIDWSCKPDAQALDDALEAGSELIPENAKFSPGRLTVMEAGTLVGGREVYDVTFRIWSTRGRTIGLFFRPQDSEVWELVTCNEGEILEGRFQSPGAYALAVGW